jgi:prolyl 4-hydroxylase
VPASRWQPSRATPGFFSYLSADGALDPLTLHSGNAVIDGEKWIAVKWLREGRYPQ